MASIWGQNEVLRMVYMWCLVIISVTVGLGYSSDGTTDGMYRSSYGYN